ncbi:DUF2489 domain-containing protein [Shewanella sp. JNE10-2]|uniref:DUF2489 domain-containing protein n=1 Tax=unclassified Shewanella TaxID=196818 RepID=UPI0020069DD6|nr:MULTISPECIES: DUF2489 domain-containing protein [unclassified Shewanella]MCK7630421.1 DUF2489 domain-containing protein [Shewanella sp. JNE9-1]MCK7634797.1 DUF2489 domain-containing protein [Shewanella sp. JNE17]MCK7645588.1 DUF2489 domain-containing protein [Shewanella sp. JNE3-1]MCK7650022.1 DUF2489 domain-containing protein [Shewanella sp. JNE8]MCK7653671.1 DUF2489 domain-containing protein [Shewanella sp. JNE4-1]
MSTALIVLGFIIIVALSSYATFLLLKLKRQKQRQQVAHAEREVAANAKRAQVLGDIRYIATAMIEDRCEISEGVVRIGRLFEILSLSERVAPEFPSLFQHFELIKGHPIMEARQALPKQERMKLDLIRMKSEAELAEGINDDAKKLSDYQLKATH